MFRRIAFGPSLLAMMAALPASAQNVKITPLGTHTGELCARDRATIFDGSAKCVAGCQ